MKDGTKQTIEFLICDYLKHLEHHLSQIITPTDGNSKS